MLQPSAAVAAPLIAPAAREARHLFVVRDDGTALTGRNLFVGVKSENAAIAKAACLAPADGGTDGLASVLDDGEAAPVGDLDNGWHIRRVPEDVNRENAARFRIDGAWDQRGIDVVGVDIDVDKARDRPFVEHAVGRGDEAERGGDDLVPIGNAVTELTD